MTKQFETNFDFVAGWGDKESHFVNLETFQIEKG
jgi:hypothetical protein